MKTRIPRTLSARRCAYHELGHALTSGLRCKKCLVYVDIIRQVVLSQRITYGRTVQMGHGHSSIEDSAFQALGGMAGDLLFFRQVKSKSEMLRWIRLKLRSRGMNSPYSIDIEQFDLVCWESAEMGFDLSSSKAQHRLTGLFVEFAFRELFSPKNQRLLRGLAKDIVEMQSVIISFEDGEPALKWHEPMLADDSHLYVAEPAGHVPNQAVNDPVIDGMKAICRSLVDGIKDSFAKLGYEVSTARPWVQLTSGCYSFAENCENCATEEGRGIVTQALAQPMKSALLKDAK